MSDTEKLPEAIETAIVRLVDAAYEDAREMFNDPVDWDSEHDDHLANERAALVVAINHELGVLKETQSLLDATLVELAAARADTARLDKAGEAMWEILQTPGLVALYDPSNRGKVIAQGPSLRDAIDDATRKENVKELDAISRADVQSLSKPLKHFTEEPQ